LWVKTVTQAVLPPLRIYGFAQWFPPTVSTHAIHGAAVLTAQPPDGFKPLFAHNSASALKDVLVQLGAASLRRTHAWVETQFT
jgi:hypothetical protein